MTIAQRITWLQPLKLGGTEIETALYLDRHFLTLL